MKKPLLPEKRLEWEGNFRKQRESGLPVDRWCRENQITVHGFYYWQRRLKLQPVLLNRENFAELKEEPKRSLVLECRGVLIHLEGHFEASVLQRCLTALKEMPC